MSALPTSSPPPPPGYAEDLEFRRGLRIGLTVLFVLIGVSVAAAILVSAYRGGMMMWYGTAAPWGWVVGAIIAVVAVVAIVAVFRVLVWGAWGAPYPRHYWRHYYRHYYPGYPPGGDSAVQIARERFARGEISQEQLDQILRQLSRPPTPPP